MPLAAPFLLLACRAPEPAAESAGLPPRHLVVAHTNDIHAHFLPAPAPWAGAELGGFVALDAQLDALRAEAGEDAVLYLDAGDLLTGTPLMEFEVHGAPGGAMLDFVQAAGLDAWAVGNHEFDRGYAAAAAFVAASPVPVLSANLRDPEDVEAPALPGLHRHVVLERNGLSIGIFGLTTETLGRLASAATMEHVQVLDAAAVAEQEVAALEPEVDLVVALTHLGVEADRDLASRVDGIDLVVGGHSHTPLDRPERVGDTWIAQTGGEGRQLGVLRFQVDERGRIRDLDGGLVDLVPGALPPDPEMVALVDRWRARVEARFQEVVGTLLGPLHRTGSGETPMGRWAADLVRAAAWADVGIYNGSGVRADLEAGPVTRGDLYGVFPFGNQVVAFNATGEELVRLALRTAWAELEGNRAPLQWSGARFEWRVRLGAPEIVAMQVGGAPVEAERTYRVATNSYVAEQWEHNLGFEPWHPEGLGVSVREVAEATLRAGPVYPPDDRRSVRLPD